MTTNDWRSILWRSHRGEERGQGLSVVLDRLSPREHDLGGEIDPVRFEVARRLLSKGGRASVDDALVEDHHRLVAPAGLPLFDDLGPTSRWRRRTRHS